MSTDDKNSKKTVYVLNGPNLNLLGTRQPNIYGGTTLTELEKLVVEYARNHGFQIVFRQTNHEGVLVDWIQEARTKADGVILNAAAYTHTSVALHDALLNLEMPIVEVHISNPHARDAFRHHSYVTGVAKREIAGFGVHGYVLALDALAYILNTADNDNQ